MLKKEKQANMAFANFQSLYSLFDKVEVDDKCNVATIQVKQEMLVVYISRSFIYLDDSIWRM